MAAQGRTVLVVENDDALRMLCRVNLELEGYQVLEADSVAAGEQLWLDEGVDVVLLDVHLGDGDGLELLERMRAKERGPAVALFTGSVEIDAARRAAVEGILEKPFTLEQLSEVVRKLAGP
ncbi:MAG: response regulator [Actinomycetota bacterium]|nr:response regulator [Actinomycetota bacterium]